MSFAQQFLPQSSEQQGVSQSMTQLRGMLRGDAAPLLEMASRPSNACTMPDGRRLTFGEFAKEMSGKSVAEMFSACGYDAAEVMNLINS